MSNINYNYFDGEYKNIWKDLMPQVLTDKEVEFMIQYFALSPASSVLDIMCGHGRHTLALASRGVNITAVDNLPDYIYEIQNEAAKKDLPVEAFQSDILSYTTTGQFDLIICMGNSLNFFNPEETRQLLKKVSASLKKGGHFLIHSWSIAEIAYKYFTDRSWTSWNDWKLLTESSFLLNPSRIESDTYFIAPNEKTETKKAIDYIYSLNELAFMLQDSGFSLTNTFSSPAKKKFTLGDHHCYIVAIKANSI